MIDFLKVEAEGSEIEVLQGIGNVDVRKIAVDCSPERNQESPAEKIRLQLEALNFKVVRRGWNLYAKLDDREPAGLGSSS
jgi:hypothetical protein